MIVRGGGGCGAGTLASGNTGAVGTDCATCTGAGGSGSIAGTSAAGGSGTAEGTGCEMAGGGSGTTTAATRGARSAAPCGARNATPGLDGVASVDRGGRLGCPPLRFAAGIERGAVFGALLFGALLGPRGARELCVVGSTDSIAAIRSACVMPAMSVAGGLALGGFESCVPRARGAVDGVRAGDEASRFGTVPIGLSPLVPEASAGFDSPDVACSSLGEPPLLATWAAADLVGFAVDSGVASGARRMT
jgi:hypothetical protein